MLPEIFRLRWRYDFKNRPSKAGQWDKDASIEGEKACRQHREGLTRAVIEGKHKESLAVMPIVDCDGQDFVNFQWMMEYRGNSKTGQGFHRHVGLELLTRKDCISVFFDGRIVKTPRSPEDMAFNYEIFGR